MVTLNCISLTKSCILASTLPRNTSHSIPQTNPKTSPVPKIDTGSFSSSSPKPQKRDQNDQKLKQRRQKQPSVAEIERAIGAGIFRDRDTESVSEENKTLFDSILSNSLGKPESSVEKKLRETGEWIIHRTETTSRSVGKQILIFVFLFAIPMWISASLLASGIVKLPFSSPFLDDLIL